MPTVPGSAGVVSSLDEALTHAGGMGYPLMIKAAAGGGGRGIRVVQDEAELRAQMPQAQAEAQAAFGYGGVYLNATCRARHIEVQVLGDGKNAIHLYERECSLQRRRQKVFEEAPSPALDAATRQRLCESAAQLARSVGYRGAGTLEFLYDDSRGAQDFYFIEMNTRIQVEHPITEAVTGVDLVREMLRIADGERCAGASRISRCAARPSNAGSMRRTRSAISRPARAASISCAGRADRECAWIPCCIRAARYRPTTIRCWPSSLSGTKTVARRWPGWRGRWTRSSWKASIPRWRCTARWRRIPRWWRATTTRTGWKPGCGRAGGAAMSVRYTHGGDEFIFAEISEDMSLESFFKGMAITRALRERAVDGVTEICPANASYQVRYDPDRIAPDALLALLRELEDGIDMANLSLDTRIIEIPVYYNDPWTHETLMRFRERHQDPASTDLEYAARINGFASVQAFIDAHAGSPWFVSMVGFVAGLPFMFQMVERERQLQVPKYLRPRTDTPRHTVGHGGCFGCIYSVRGAGGYQMFGVTPAPIFEPGQRLAHLRDSMVFFRPGDIVKFKPINREEYDRAEAQVEDGSFALRIRPVSFSLAEFLRAPQSCNARLLETLHG